MDIRTFDGVWSPELRNRRRIDVYLPASYAPGSRRRYPVIYMLDGQNLSDPARAFAGTWELPRAMDALASDGLEFIVVGIDNGGDARLAEYSPWSDARHGGGQGTTFLRFLVDRLKPRLDRRFRTRPDAASTGIVGSSMGGLLSFYAFFRHRRVFGFAGALSPALWFGDRRVFEYVERGTMPRGRLYLDVGTAEGAEALRDVRRMRRVLLAKSPARGTLRYVEAEGHPHAEWAWAARLPDALRFLLGDPSMSHG
jgi:predicted alpha/beta superfamily hydrolase